VKVFLQRHLTLLTTAVVLLALYVTASCLYDGFFSAGVFVNLLTDNAALGITAVGLTLVIFSGGIDLSVGAVVGFTSIFTATLVQQHGFHPFTAAALALAIGAGLGAAMGTLIHVFRQPPFLITLAGMFFMRGCAFWITTESTPIDHPLFQRFTAFAISFGKAFSLPAPALALLVVLAAGGTIAHYTRFGRYTLAVGGSESSALLMGLPLGATKIGVYVFCSVCATIGGLVATIYTGAGNPSLGIGLELDAIAVVVIGGTLLTGGRGHMLGTVLGILIFGTIQSALLFDGRLNSWWVRIVVGALLLAFILLQRFLVRGLGRRGQ
jgi:ribose/xylose/arabinose/galactoside ABC-type transport system permease subunit